MTKRTGRATGPTLFVPKEPMAEILKVTAAEIGKTKNGYSLFDLQFDNGERATKLVPVRSFDMRHDKLYRFYAENDKSLASLVGRYVSVAFKDTQWGKEILHIYVIDAVNASPSQVGSNTTHLRLVGQLRAVLDVEELTPSAARDSVRLHVNPETADARYFTHWLNESLLGQTTLASVCREGALGRVDLEALLASTFLLPPLPDQRKILQALEYLSKIRAEATELETALCASVSNIDPIAQQIKTINQEDRYEDWIETRQGLRPNANSRSCLSVASPGHNESANHRKNELAARRLLTPSLRQAFPMVEARSVSRSFSNRVT